MKQFIDKLIERLEEESRDSQENMAKATGTSVANFCSDARGAYNKTIAIVNQLAEEFATEYEIAEEQGLILRLPCKFGDTVYWIRPNVSGVPTEVMETKFDDSMISRLDLFGKVFFTTKEEAEQALKQMGE